MPDCLCGAAIGINSVQRTNGKCSRTGAVAKLIYDGPHIKKIIVKCPAVKE